MRTPRLLLVNPATGPSFWGLDYAMDLLGGTYSNAPLALLTVAGLTPDDWDISLQDENVAPIDLDTPCDVVGLSVMNVQASRAFALADEFRRRGRLVVMGGPLVSLEPERCAPHADIIFAGEAERTWPLFCQDLRRDEHRSVYVETAKMDLGISPVPRYDLTQPGAYASLPIQTTRGCPFGCEFCDVIILQGRRVRTKSCAQVLAELDAIRAQGSGAIFFTDDNFVANVPYATRLLRELIEHRERTGYEPLIFTQASVNLAEQTELLRLMPRAGMTRVFLGVESPRQESLREAKKHHNACGSLVERIHTIQRAGMFTWAGMIVGFDHDDASIFGEQASFLDEAGIAVAMVGMLNAPPGTPLFERLQREGRIAQGVDWTDNCAFTNITPKCMSRDELMRGYGDLLCELYDQQRYVARLHANIARMSKPIHGTASARVPSVPELTALVRAIRAFTFSRDHRSRRHFVPNLLRIFRYHPSRAVEGAIHLGLWRHFSRYVPELVDRLDAAVSTERVRAREMDHALSKLEHRQAVLPSSSFLLRESPTQKPMDSVAMPLV